ncbi:hypothetical protein ALQ36_102222 [Pseudomonas syringae pv. primulae]|uniref:Uncharacterized protein n=1 Tax=Pseudomonas syringae pv. primulae TaxID=251707 RepID=A0A3M3YJ67_9PSED|nr:hypothetical protein ALQ36_102222 [Pseudomonas syringae pv. primulae]RMU33066.1 hypothetical protein ALP30_102449 [Pseudomonas syringae pv. primulae]
MGSIQGAATRQTHTGKKTAPTLPLCLPTAEMPCRFSGIAASALYVTLAIIGFCNMARRLLCQ